MKKEHTCFDIESIRLYGLPDNILVKTHCFSFVIVEIVGDSDAVSQIKVERDEEENGLLWITRHNESPSNINVSINGGVVHGHVVCAREISGCFNGAGVGTPTRVIPLTPLGLATITIIVPTGMKVKKSGCTGTFTKE